MKFVVPIAHRPTVNSVTITGDKRPSNKQNDPFSSSHSYITLKDTEVQPLTWVYESQSFLCEGINSCSTSNGYKAPFKTNNCGRSESFIIKSLKPL